MGSKGGSLPKALRPFSDNISTKTKVVLSRYLNLIDDESSKSIKFLLTNEGQRGIDVAMKLELKEQQIRAQASLNTTALNPLLVILKQAEAEGYIDVTPGVREIDRIDNMPNNKLERECAKDIKGS